MVLFLKSSYSTQLISFCCLFFSHLMLLYEKRLSKTYKNFRKTNILIISILFCATVQQIPKKLKVFTDITGLLKLNQSLDAKLHDTINDSWMQKKREKYSSWRPSTQRWWQVMCQISKWTLSQIPILDKRGNNSLGNQGITSIRRRAERGLAVISPPIITILQFHLLLYHKLNSQSKIP